MGKPVPASLHSIATDWRDMVLVCHDCSRDGFGPDGEDGLKRALKRALRACGQRGQIGVMEVECFGICPKRAVTVALASQPGQLKVVPEGQTGEAVLAQLGVTAP